MKKQLLCVIMTLSIVIGGCTQSYGVISPTEGQQTQTSLPFQAANPAQIAQAVAYVKPTDIPSTISKKVQGKIKGIYYAGGNQVIINANQFYLMNLKTGELIAKTVKEELDELTFYTITSGYIAIGKPKQGKSALSLSISNSAPQPRCIFYNKGLKKTSELDFAKLIGKDDYIPSTRLISISSDGNIIAYAVLSKGLYTYNLKQSKKTAVIDLKKKNAKALSGLCLIEQVGFTNNNKSIPFKGQSNDVPAVANKPSFDTFGIVNIDGSGFSNKKAIGYAAKELTAYNKKLLWAQDFTSASGKAMIMDSSTGKTKVHMLISKKEAGNVYGSDTGRYFGTSTLIKTGWTIRVYDMENGKLKAEKQVSNDGQRLYSNNDPIIRILDNMNTCIVLQGAQKNAVPTKITSFSF